MSEKNATGEKLILYSFYSTEKLHTTAKELAVIRAKILKRKPKLAPIYLEAVRRGLPLVAQDLGLQEKLGVSNISNPDLKTLKKIVSNLIDLGWQTSLNSTLQHDTESPSHAGVSAENDPVATASPAY